MIKFLLSFILIGSLTTCSQSGKLRFLSSLPKSMKEVSGIEKIPNSDLLWMINDSGNSNELFGYNLKTKSIERSIIIDNGTNIDWEDLASDQTGTIYIGDFGNNKNMRKNLSIYTLKNIIHETGDKKSAEITSFYYEDQKKYPPKNKHLNYDVEAFIYLNNYFYLFTRNRSNQFDGMTKLYRVPAKEGYYKAELIDQFKTCDQKKGCQITSAAIHQQSGIIALLSYNKVWILSNYQEDQFFGGDILRIELDHYSQKESITFKDKNSLLISDEQTGNKGGNLYLLKIPQN